MHRRATRTIAAALAALVCSEGLLVGTAAAAVLPHEGPETPQERVVVDLGASADPETTAARIDRIAAARGAEVSTIPLPLSGQVALVGDAGDLAAIGPATDALGEVVGTRIDPPVAALGVVPDDPGWFRQSSLRDAAFDEAWQTGTGSPQTVIAVLDTGVNPSPDLADRLLPGINLMPRGTPAPAGDGTDTTDDNGHGSAVAAVAAAAGDDGWGIAGACWQCLVLPVRVLDASGQGSLSTVAEGIRWAVEHGADVINLSLGGTSGGPDLAAALAEAASAGVVVVAAAGNDGSTVPHYPAAVDSVIAVAGTSGYDPATLHGNSTRGASWVDVAAPFCNRFDDSDTIFCGTSSATPVVAGLAGLLVSDVPALGPTGVREALGSTATPVAPEGSVASGAVRADAAVEAALAMQVAPPVASTPHPASMPSTPSDRTAPVVTLAAPWAWTSGPVTTTVRADDPGGVVSVHLDVDGREITSSPGGGLVGLRWDSTGVGDGWHLVRARAVDSEGNVGAAEVWWPVDNHTPVLRITPPAWPVVNRSFTVGYDVGDASGIKATLVASGGRWIAVSSGSGHFEAAVPVSGPGEVWVVAITVDNAGRASFSNIVTVRSTAKAHRAGRRRR